MVSIITGWLLRDGSLNSALECTSCNSFKDSNSLFAEGKLIYIFHRENIFQGSVMQSSS